MAFWLVAMLAAVPQRHGKRREIRVAEWPAIACRCFLTVTDPCNFNGLAQTTNLGVRSSNLFGRATSVPLSGRCLCYAGAESPPLFKARWRPQGAGGYGHRPRDKCVGRTQSLIGADRDIAI